MVPSLSRLLAEKKVTFPLPLFPFLYMDVSRQNQMVPGIKEPNHTKKRVKGLEMLCPYGF